MPLVVTMIYSLLAVLSVALSFLPPFAGIGVFRALPTILLAGVAVRRTRPRFSYAVALAVALGAAGDFFLASQSRSGFIPGLVVFLVGHLCYLWAFSRDLRPTRGRLSLLSVALLGLLVLSGLTVRKLIHADEHALIAPVLLYVAVLGTTMVVCLFHTSPTPWIAVGGVVFVISDAHIAVNHILLVAPLLPITLSGYTTYYLAQFLLVHGAARETEEEVRG